MFRVDPQNGDPQGVQRADRLDPPPVGHRRCRESEIRRSAELTVPAGWRRGRCRSPVRGVNREPTVQHSHSLWVINDLPSVMGRFNEGNEPPRGPGRETSPDDQLARPAPKVHRPGTAELP